MQAGGGKAFSFAGYTLDLLRGCLRAGEREIELRPKSFALLRHLVENAGRLASKDELFKAVWPDVVVSDESLAHCVSEVRAALGDDEQRIIRTVPRRGYLFAAAVSGAPAELNARTDTVATTPRLSIVVLPFTNLSGDAERDYFVDGLTDDLTTELSRLPGFFVIARNSAFSYRGRSPDVRQIGRDLGVRYVLEGSVRKSGQRARVTAQLIDAETGAHLWADRFDRHMTDLFELQDAITAELAGALDVRLIEAESRRSERLANPDPLDLVMRARAIDNRGISRPNYNAAIELYEKALDLDPRNVPALTGLADALGGRATALWSEARHDDIGRAEALVSCALALDPQGAWCHYAQGRVYRLQNRFDDAVGALETALRLNPSLHLARLERGNAEVYGGRAENGPPRFADFIRLSPRDPKLSQGYICIGWARFLLGDYQGAIELLRKAMALSRETSYPNLYLAAAYALENRFDEAQAAVAAYLANGTPTNTVGLVRATAPSTHPTFVAQRERLHEGLRRAGMPEE
jgi:TolB-like protein/cytochrome c-type biogenesis protein CcmH/NrfG